MQINVLKSSKITVFCCKKMSVIYPRLAETDNKLNQPCFHQIIKWFTAIPIMQSVINVDINPPPLPVNVINIIITKITPKTKSINFCFLLVFWIVLVFASGFKIFLLLVAIGLPQFGQTSALSETYFHILRNLLEPYNTFLLCCLLLNVYNLCNT